MTNKVYVEFTKSSWSQFNKINHSLGERFIKSFVLRRELAEYIALHYKSGNPLDSICQEVSYGDGLRLQLTQHRDVWYITDIWYIEEPISSEPVFFWQRVMRGCDTILRQAVAAWRYFIRKPDGREVTGV